MKPARHIPISGWPLTQAIVLALLLGSLGAVTPPALAQAAPAAVSAKTAPPKAPEPVHPKGNLSATPLIFGQVITNSILGGVFVSPQGTVVPGTLAFVNPTNVPSAGTHSVPILFTPGNTNDYSPYHGTVGLTVAKDFPLITPPSPTAITLGEPLRDSVLSGGSATNAINGQSVPGTFSFADPSTIAVAATKAGVVFTPTDSTDYSNVTIYLIVGVTPLILPEGNLAATRIVFGEAISNSVLTGVFTNAQGSVLAGVLAFAFPTNQPPAGITNAPVVFTPADTNDYSQYFTTVAVPVGRDTPVLTLPTAAAVSKGQALSAFSLSGGAATNANNSQQVQGTFAFVTPTLIVDATTVESLIFTPKDTADYTLAFGVMQITVSNSAAHGTVKVKGSLNATPIVFGQAVSNSIPGGVFEDQFGATVLGTLVFASLTNVPATAGTNNVAVIFTPFNTNYYSVFQTTAPLPVEKAIPILTPPTASSIIARVSITNSILSGGTATNPINGQSVAGSFTFGKPALQLSASTNVSVTFVPTLTADYSNATTTVTVPIVQEYAASGPKAATNIVYGEIITNAGLTGAFTNASGVPVPGTLTFVNPTSVPNAGVTNVPVLFTPVDLTNYIAFQFTVPVTVNRATLAVTANSFTRLIDTANPPFTAAYAGFVNGDTATNALKGAPDFSSTARLNSPAGTYPITVSAGTLTATNYTFHFYNGTLTVTNGAKSMAIEVQPRAVGGGPFQMRVSALAGTAVIVESSPDLLHWTPVLTNTIQQDSLSIPLPLSQDPVRFYRVRQP